MILGYVEMPIKMQLSKLNYDCIPSYERKRIAGKKSKCC